MALEVEVQLQDAPVERASKTVAFWHLPFPVYDCKRNVFVGGSSVEPDGESVWCRVRLQVKLWRSCLVRQVRVENVEFVSLDDLGRRILWVIVSLVIFVPLKALLHTIEKPWFSLHIKLVNRVYLCLFTELFALCNDYIREFLLIRT